MALTPQAMLKARFSELAESLNIDLIVRKQTGKFYFTVTGSFKNTEKFMQGSFPKAWMTSGSGDEVVYGLPLGEIEKVLSEVQIDLDWLKRNDSAALQIAQKIRDEEAFDHLPILADALEEAGCNLTGILNHCRESIRHKHTCWVVELLLGPKRKRRQNSQHRTTRRRAQLSAAFLKQNRTRLDAIGSWTAEADKDNLDVIWQSPVALGEDPAWELRFHTDSDSPTFDPDEQMFELWGAYLGRHSRVKAQVEMGTSSEYIIEVRRGYSDGEAFYDVEVNVQPDFDEHIQRFIVDLETGEVENDS
jgi:hypothetical protein